MCRIHLFWDVCKGGEEERADSFLHLYFARPLPGCWQNFATPVGKTLPIMWQTVANLLARLCHAIGKTLPLNWQELATSLSKRSSGCHSVSESIYALYE